jgi:hypothetical protein
LTGEWGSGGARPPGVSSASIFLGADKRNFCGIASDDRRSALTLFDAVAVKALIATLVDLILVELASAAETLALVAGTGIFDYAAFFAVRQGWHHSSLCPSTVPS